MVRLLHRVYRITTLWQRNDCRQGPEAAERQRYQTPEGRAWVRHYAPAINNYRFTSNKNK